MNYVGRFAPSPSGLLHFGSLVAALGSYFQAKAQHGRWLIRIEDLDPPREMPGAATHILHTLEQFGLEWDGDIVYQSQRHAHYQAQIDEWLTNGQAYYCQCTRKQIKANGGFYSGLCRQRALAPSPHHAIRLFMQNPVESFPDLHQGNVSIPKMLAHEDFIIKRRDGHFAYNLAVVIDDIAQGVTEVVRGADLIEPTGRQISLYHTLRQSPVRYLHLPLAMDDSGKKFSKQNHAQPIDPKQAKSTLMRAMTFLGFDLPENFHSGTIEQMLQWGIHHWCIQQLPTENHIIV
ncbi:MAG: tRNA glutamyl-Q(34) synthetase GluQRS [Vibrio sp.]